MNFIFVSPNFPVRYFKWVEALRDHGVNVLGIGDTPYNNLHPRLINALTEYYFVSNMSNDDEMDRAVEYFQNKYGKIDFIESMNEWWLGLDARLRTKFNICTGFHTEDMQGIKAKSAMKQFFEKGGAKTIRYLVVSGKQDKEEATKFVRKVGYPVFVKPNIGVGACDSYSLHNKEEFDAFFEKELPEPYIMEEYIDGMIVSFDGICNDEGDVSFCVSDHFPTPVADIVNKNLDYYYFTNPFDLEMKDLDGEAFLETGRNVVKAFGIRKRFFHIEFFVLNKDKRGLGKKGDFIALECNMRAPGGYTPDLINFAASTSVYQVYADVICYNENRQYDGYDKFYGFAVHRRDCFEYLHSDEEIQALFHNNLCMHGRYPAHIAAVMGDHYYFAKFKTYEEGIAFDEYVRAKR